MLSLLAGLSVPAAAQQDSTGIAFVDQTIEVGANKNFSRETSTAAVSVITNKDVNKRSAKNIGNSILGQGNGLISLQGGGTFFEQNPTFYIRGLQSLSVSSPLVLVDGVERDISYISADEVEEVQILKDAAAVALYGYKGTNGALLIKTKRGEYNSKTIKFTYDHEFRQMMNRPKFIDGATYASAMNEALYNEGQGQFAKYSADEIAAFQNGTHPYQYPSVNWVGETFRNHALDNRLGLEFSGGGAKFRYFTAATLISDKGFIKNPAMNEDYNTQDKYVRGNIRTNLDIDLTPNTMMRVNLLGMLSEMSRPGSNVDLWGMMYSVPSAAFPIRNEKGTWGGSSTWAGTNNPVAQSTGAAYYKIHERALNLDAVLDQKLDSWTKGLSLTVKASYDIYSTLYEDHSKEYLYGYTPVTGWANGEPVLGDYWEGGKQGEMGAGAATDKYARRMTFGAGFNYNRSFGKHSVYSQLMYGYDFEETTGVNTKIYRQNISWLGHYAYNNKYIGELALMESGSSRLAPGTKWAMSPTVSAAWVVSNENFLKDSSWLNFLKLRASFGVISADYLPGDNVWTYYTQSYSTNGTQYLWGAGYDTNDKATVLGQMATANPSHEKARKLNIGIDATLFKGLNIEFDYFNQHRYDIWVSGAGAFSSLIGFEAPYVNAGVVDQYGFDLALDYTKSIGDVTFNIGGNMTLSKNEIKEQAEEPKAYANLVTTGNPLNSNYGLVAEGLFRNEDFVYDKDGNPTTLVDGIPAHTFSQVRPGDIRYKDVNGDGKIDANDKTKIGYSSTCPELYYSFHLGAEYKGLGFTALFQGAGRYTAMLSNSGYYWGLVNNTSLAQYVYDNRWTAESNDPNAMFPRLSSTSNANNYQASTFWMRDRSFLKLRNVEVYYNLPKAVMKKTGFVNAAKVYVRGNDLFCADHIEGRDAEILGNGTPASRSIIVGAQLTF